MTPCLGLQPDLVGFEDLNGALWESTPAAEGVVGEESCDAAETHPQKSDNDSGEKPGVHMAGKC